MEVGGEPVAVEVAAVEVAAVEVAAAEVDNAYRTQSICVVNSSCTYRGR